MLENKMSQNAEADFFCYFTSGSAPRGTFRGRALPIDCLCPQTKIGPPKRGLCPEKINRLGATGAQIETKDSQTGVYRPIIREQELFFCNFCGLTPVS